LFPVKNKVFPVKNGAGPNHFEANGIPRAFEVCGYAAEGMPRVSATVVSAVKTFVRVSETNVFVLEKDMAGAGRRGAETGIVVRKAGTTPLSGQGPL
jgi:hypothetical protein